MNKIVGPIIPLTEGKYPPDVILNKDGDIEYREHVPDPDYVDSEIREEELYSVLGKDEFYGHVTVCKSCLTEFIAYDPKNDWKYVRDFCPGCGKRLVTS